MVFAMTRPQQRRLNRWWCTAIALACLTAPALACGPPFHQTILFDVIPPEAEKSEVIARVEILDVQIRDLPGLWPLPVARARVLQSIRGTVVGQIVEIDASNPSCGGGLDHSAVGRQGFIAGRFYQYADETYFFDGRWGNWHLAGSGERS